MTQIALIDNALVDLLESCDLPGVTVQTAPHEWDQGYIQRLLTVTPALLVAFLGAEPFPDTPTSTTLALAGKWGVYIATGWQGITGVSRRVVCTVTSLVDGALCARDAHGFARMWDRAPSPHSAARPESELRRHHSRSRCRVHRSATLNEGRSLNSGDTPNRGDLGSARGDFGVFQSQTSRRSGRTAPLQSPGQAPIIIATLAPAAGPPEPAGVRCLGNIRPGR